MVCRFGIYLRYSNKRARKIYNKHPCTSLGMVSDNKETNIQFCKDNLNKESSDDIHLTLKTHSVDTYKEQ